jgi:hypothetical protein
MQSVIIELMEAYMNRLEELEEKGSHGELDAHEMEEARRLYKLKEDVEAAVETLANAVNVMGTREQAFVADVLHRRLDRQHRTLQQNFWRMIAKIIQKVGETPEHYYDLRNEASVKWAQEVSKIEKHFPFI